MTALPASFYLGPEMAEFGISLAGAALAGDGQESADATRKLMEAIEGLRSAFREAKLVTRARLEELFERVSGTDKRVLLENMRTAEHVTERSTSEMERYLSPGRQALLATSAELGTLPYLQAFRDELRRDQLPHLRALHASMIALIIQHAACWEIGVEAEEGLEERLKAADPEQLEQWHETAALLIDEEEARRLVAAARTPPEDHHDEFLRYAADGGPAA